MRCVRVIHNARDSVSLILGADLPEHCLGRSSSASSDCSSELLAICLLLSIRTRMADECQSLGREFISNWSERCSGTSGWPSNWEEIACVYQTRSSFSFMLCFRIKSADSRRGLKNL